VTPLISAVYHLLAANPQVRRIALRRDVFWRFASDMLDYELSTLGRYDFAPIGAQSFAYYVGGIPRVIEVRA
jgi:hypothetical protein